MAAAAAVLWSFPLTVPASAQQHDFPRYDDEGFTRLFDALALPGTIDIGDPPPITGDAGVDTAIRQRAEERGYRLRPMLTVEPVWVDGVPLHPTVAEAWNRLRDAATEDGFRLQMISGFRSVAIQRRLFLEGMADFGPAAIDRRLAWAAPPGYSKHHTGYAVDITQVGYRGGDFDLSPAWTWLTADNAYNAKRFGFVPSYPSGAPRQGPDPEPWEWTYVGVEEIARGRTPEMTGTPDRIFGYLLAEDSLRIPPLPLDLSRESVPSHRLSRPGVG